MELVRKKDLIKIKAYPKQGCKHVLVVYKRSKKMLSGIFGDKFEIENLHSTKLVDGEYVYYKPHYAFNRRIL